MDREVEDLFTITSSQKGDSLPATSAHISSFMPKLEESGSKLLVSASGIEGAREVIRKSGKRLDVYALEQEFLAYARKTGFEPGNVDGAFVGFVKRKLVRPFK